jgi:hypothetical protein
VVRLTETIRSLFARWDEPPAVEPVLFGTADPAEIAALAGSFCRAHLGAPIAGPLFYRSSVGAVFGVTLGDGRAVVVKVHQPNVDPAFLAAVHRVQQQLTSTGFPCPRPLLGPTPFAQRRGAHATVESYLAEGDYRNPHEPPVRRAMVSLLARQVELARPFAHDAGFDSMRRSRRRLPADCLWPSPHSPLFDFEGTAAGAEWIDDIGRAAREILDATPDSPLIVGHCDWSAKHFRFRGDDVRAVYDWDSLRVDPEPEIVGRAAHAFTATYGTPWEGKVPTAPTFEQVLAFLADYEHSRGAPFSAQERRTFGAACAYSLAYSSRCSQARDPRPGRVADFPPGNWRYALNAFGEQLLTF